MPGAVITRDVDVLVEASPLIDARRTAGIGRYARSLLGALDRVEGIEVTLTRPQRPERETWNLRFRSAQDGVLAALRRRRPDVVHALASEPVVGWPLSRQVVTVHDVLPWAATARRAQAARRLHHSWQRDRIARCGAVIAVSEDVAREVEAVLGVDPARIRVIPEAASAVFSPIPRSDDYDRRRAAGIDADDYLLWVGSLRAHDPRKRLDCLLDAIARLGETAPLLVMVGACGAESRRLAHRARRTGVRMRLTGYVSDATLAAVYRGATAVLLPSDYEGFGLPVLEAMACGAPAIFSSVGNLNDLASGVGVRTPVADSVALADAVTLVGAGAALRERLKAVGPTRAARFSWMAAAVATGAVYRAVAFSSAATSSATSRPGSRARLSS